MNVNIKLQPTTQELIGIDKIVVTLNENDTILMLKEQLISKYNILSEGLIRLIYAGKMLKDQDTILQHKISDEKTIHLVFNKTNKETVPPISTTPTINTTNTTNINTTDNELETDEPLPDLFTGQNTGQNMGQMPDLSSLLGNLNQMPSDTEMQNIMGNPAMPGLMQSIMSNPETFQRMNNISSRLNDGSLNYSNMMSDPEFTQLMQDPVMSSAMQQVMTSQMAGTGMSTGLNPLQMMGGLGTTPNTSTSGTNNDTPQVSTPPTSSVDYTQYREQYKDQLEILNNMGFTDENQNLQALYTSQGNVDFAVNRLLEQ